MQIYLNFWTWRKTLVKKRWELGNSSMVFGFQTYLWFEWRIMRCGVSCVHTRVQVYMTVMERSLKHFTQSKCSYASDVCCGRLIIINLPAIIIQKGWDLNPALPNQTLQYVRTMHCVERILRRAIDRPMLYLIMKHSQSFLK